MKTLPLTIEGAIEAFDLLDGLEEDIGGLPYRDAKDAIARIEALRGIVGDTFPGGYAGPCEACGKPIGSDEIKAFDFDNGGHFCADCAPSPEEIAAQQAELPEGSPNKAGDDAQPYQAPAADADGWIDWPGGECPLHEGAIVDVERRDGAAFKAAGGSRISGFISRADVLGAPASLLRHRSLPASPRCQTRGQR